MIGKVLQSIFTEVDGNILQISMFYINHVRVYFLELNSLNRISFDNYILF